MKLKLYILTLSIFSVLFTHAQAWQDSLRLGKKYYQEEEYDKAYKILMEAQKIAPAEIDLSKDIGNAAYRSNRFEMATKAYNAAANNMDDSHKKAKYWHNTGNSQFQSKQYREAIESYKNALRADASSDETRYNLAKAQRLLEQEQQGQQQQNQEQQNQDQEQQNEEQATAQSNPQDDENNAENQDSQENQDEAGQSSSESSIHEGNNERQTPNLSEDKIDRAIEDLLKEEMKTKDKIRKRKLGREQNSPQSGKRW